MASDSECQDCPVHALCAAAQQGARLDEAAVRQAGVEHLECVHGGNLPLQVAARLSAELVEVLLRCGANVNALGPRGEAALMIAVRFPSESAHSIVTHLLSAGADRTITDKEGWTPERMTTIVAGSAAEEGIREFVTRAVHRACDSQDMPQLQGTLGGDDGVAARDLAGFMGTTPLMLCAKGGWVAGAEALLRSGARPDVTDHLGRSALWYAASRNHAGIVAALLDAGADFVRADIADGNAPLDDAVCKGSLEAANSLINAGAARGRGGPALIWAIRGGGGFRPHNPDGGFREGFKEVFFRILDSTADVNHVEGEGWSPLIHSIARYCNEATTALLAAGATPQALPDQQRSPLFVACDCKNEFAVRLLLENGAAVADRRPDGSKGSDSF